jgi:hypothetical protein
MYGISHSAGCPPPLICLPTGPHLLPPTHPCSPPLLTQDSCVGHSPLHLFPLQGLLPRRTHAYCHPGGEGRRQVTLDSQGDVLGGINGVRERYTSTSQAAGLPSPRPQAPLAQLPGKQAGLRDWAWGGGAPWLPTQGCLPES